MARKYASVLNAVANLGILTAATFILLAPGGVIRKMWHDYRERATTEQRVKAHWDDMTARRLYGSDAAVSVIEFTDYQCPYCEEAHRLIKEIVADDPQVSVAVVHFPLTSLHPSAEGAARAAICAELQGRFAEMNDYLFETDDWEDGQDWMSAAEAVAVPDIELFRSCLDDTNTTARLDRDRTLGERLGIRATPSFAFRYGLFTGIPSSEEFLTWVAKGR